MEGPREDLADRAEGLARVGVGAGGARAAEHVTRAGGGHAGRHPDAGDAAEGHEQGVRGQVVAEDVVEVAAAVERADPPHSGLEPAETGQKGWPALVADPAADVLLELGPLAADDRFDDRADLVAGEGLVDVDRSGGAHGVLSLGDARRGRLVQRGFGCGRPPAGLAGRRLAALDQDQAGPADPDGVPDRERLLADASLVEVGPVEALEVADAQDAVGAHLELAVTAGDHVVLEDDVPVGARPTESADTPSRSR